MPARPHNFAPALYGIVMSATPLLIGCAVAHYNSAVPVEHPAFSGVIAVLWEMPPGRMRSWAAWRLKARPLLMKR
jgi:hypothetical protein